MKKNIYIQPETILVPYVSEMPLLADSDGKVKQEYGEDPYSGGNNSGEIGGGDDQPHETGAKNINLWDEWE